VFFTMAERATLQAAPRTVLGKKVSSLRREGILPANVYGRGVPSLAVQLDNREFQRTVRAAGVRSMFELAVQGVPQPRYVLVRGLDRAGGTGDPIHVDFYQVDLRRPIQTNVPVRLAGESPAVHDLAGTLLQMVDIVSVQCLPLAIPESLDVDVSRLVNFEITLTVGDLIAPEGVEIMTDPSVPVATVTPPRLRLEAEEGEEGEGLPGEAAAEEEAASAEPEK
jgi:large subunit ribosomal protein L25